MYNRKDTGGLGHFCFLRKWQIAEVVVFQSLSHDRFFVTPWNEAGQRLTEFAKEMHWSYQTPSSNNTREDSTHGHHQMVNSEIRLIMFFAAKDGEALYSQQKQDWELIVAQIMNSLLPNSDLN